MRKDLANEPMKMIGDVTLFTIEDKEDKVENPGFSPAKKVPQYVAALSASLAAMSLGTSIGWTSQISQRLMDGELNFDMTEDELGWAGSFVSLGCAFLSLFAGSMCDFFGRKNAMLLLILVSSAGWANLLWASSVTMIYIGRFLTGMAGGAYCVCIPMYTSEIAQKEIRGSLGCFLQLQISAGILLAMILGKFLTIQYLTLICGIIPLLFGAIFVFMPESPTYFLKNNKEEKAIISMRRLWGANYDCDYEIKEIKATMEDQFQGNMFEVFWNSVQRSGSRKSCYIGVGLMIFKVLCAVDAITAFTSYILQSTGMTLDPTTGGIIFSVIQLVSAVVQSAIVDKLGRRVLLIFSEAAMATCLFIVMISLLLKDRNILSQENLMYIEYLPLIALCVFTIAFSMGLGPIPFMMISEIFPQEIKSLMSSFCTFLCWFLAFAVIKGFIVIKGAFGGDSAFGVFAVLTTLGVLFICLLVPETKGKSFNEIQNELADDY